MTENKTNLAVVRAKTALQRQRRIALILLIAVALLGVALGLTLFFTSRTAFYDPTDNTKYYVAKEGDVYVLKTTAGKILPKTSEGNYITDSGTIVYVNKSTGEHSTVAAVLVEDGETVQFDTLDSAYDVLLYPYLERKGIGAIEVHNKNGSFKFIRVEVTEDAKTDVKFIIEGRPDLAVDQSKLFATLIYCTGKTTTMLRLDTNRVKELGYAEYGLPEDTATAEQYFVITAYDENPKDSTPPVSHKVIIGDEVPSGNGYYVRYEGREAVYVLSELTASEYNGTFAEALLGKVEAYVTAPTASYNMSSSNYFDVTDFKIQQNGSAEPIIDFSLTGSIEKRNNTYYSNIPYVANSGLTGYSINSYRVDDCLYALYTWAPDFVVALGTEATMGEDLDAWLAPYGLDAASYAYNVSFIFNRDRSYNAETGKDVVKKEDQEKHIILISHKQEDGFFYVYNICYLYDKDTRDFTKPADGYNMVVAINEEQLNFLFFTTKDWISADLFSGQIAYIEEMTVKIAAGSVSQYPSGYEQIFTFDNSATLEELAKGSISNSKISTDKLVVRDSAGKILNTMQVKTFYSSLLYTTCSGYSSLSDAQKEQHIASGTAGAKLVIKLKYVLRELDKETGYYVETGEVIEREYCFYEDLTYPRQYFTTVNGKGEFYTVSTRVKKVINDIMKLYGTPETDPIKYDSLT